MNESKRQKTLAKQIQRDLSDIFLHHKDKLNGRFITITEVKISGDLSVAKVFVSGLLNKNENDGLLELLDENKPFIRKELGKIIKNSVRIVPELRFVLDDTEVNANSMEELMAKLAIPPPKDETEFGDTYRP
jgi:ribosome-binding factor A